MPNVRNMREGNYVASNIQLIPDAVIRQLALQAGLDYNDAMFLVGKANATQTFLELDTLMHKLPQEHCRAKKNVLIGIQHTLLGLTGISVAVSLYFRTVSDREKVHENSDGNARNLLYTDMISFGSSALFGLSSIIFNFAKSQIDRKMESNLRNKHFFLQKLILLMKGKESWEKDYTNTSIKKVAIAVDGTCIIPMSDSNVRGISYVKAESIVNQRRRHSTI
jgi:hypothetical protein